MVSNIPFHSPWFGFCAGLGLGLVLGHGFGFGGSWFGHGFGLEGWTDHCAHCFLTCMPATPTFSLPIPTCLPHQAYILSLFHLSSLSPSLPSLSLLFLLSPTSLSGIRLFHSLQPPTTKPSHPLPTPATPTSRGKNVCVVWRRRRRNSGGQKKRASLRACLSLSHCIASLFSSLSQPSLSPAFALAACFLPHCSSWHLLLLSSLCWQRLRAMHICVSTYQTSTNRLLSLLLPFSRMAVAFCLCMPYLSMLKNPL